MSSRDKPSLTSSDFLQICTEINNNNNKKVYQLRTPKFNAGFRKHTKYKIDEFNTINRQELHTRQNAFDSF